MIALFLTITMIASTIFAISPFASAQTVQKYPTFLYAAAAPNPVGIGQPITVVTWTAEIPPDIGETVGNVIFTKHKSWMGWYDVDAHSA